MGQINEAALVVPFSSLFLLEGVLPSLTAIVSLFRDHCKYSLMGLLG